MTAGYTGLQSYADGGHDYAELMFVINMAMRRISTCTLVEVKTVTNDGGVSPVGFVDVKPMVHMLDGDNNAIPHGVIYHVPYFRLQGGQNAVICDPVVGDIGLCSFASHDISSVKTNKAESNPGSRRRFNMADGLYMGGFLNSAPKNYIQFTAGGIKINAPSVKVSGNFTVENGVTGSFTTPTGQTVTVIGGIVTGLH